MHLCSPFGEGVLQAADPAAEQQDCVQADAIPGHKPGCALALAAATKLDIKAVGALVAIQSTIAAIMDTSLKAPEQ